PHHKKTQKIWIISDTSGPASPNLQYPSWRICIDRVTCPRVKGTEVRQPIPSEQPLTKTPRIS
ncbi:hypothetical protein ScPMuIL_013495, partial [Solemya velum]